MTNDDTHLSIGIEDLHYCPVCGEEFDSERWNDEGGHHYRSGGQTTYSCPDEDCDGTVSVYI